MRLSPLFELKGEGYGVGGEVSHALISTRAPLYSMQQHALISWPCAREGIVREGLGFWQSVSYDPGTLSGVIGRGHVFALLKATALHFHSARALHDALTGDVHEVDEAWGSHHQIGAA